MHWFFKLINLIFIIGGVIFFYNQATFFKGNYYVFKASPTLAVYAKKSDNPLISLSFIDQWLANRFACSSQPMTCDAIQNIELDNDPSTRETLMMSGTDECEPDYCGLWLSTEKKVFDEDGSWSSMWSVSYFRPGKMPITILDQKDEKFSRIRVIKKNGEVVVHKYKLDEEGFGSYN